MWRGSVCGAAGGARSSGGRTRISPALPRARRWIRWTWSARSARCPTDTGRCCCCTTSKATGTRRSRNSSASRPARRSHSCFMRGGRCAPRSEDMERMDIVHDEPEVTGPDEELSPGEKRAFAALPRELEPKASLEERTVAMLRQHGQLPIPLVSRRPDARTPRTYWIAAGAIAAALAIFASGIAVGQYLGMTGAVNLAQLTAQSSATQAAAHVRHAGDMYVAALASLNNLRDTTDVQGREQARKFALAALGAAAEEVAHIAPDDPLAAAVLRGLNQRTRDQQPPASSRTVVWY